MKTTNAIEQVSKTPKHKQVSRSIIDSIDAGILLKGSKLPSINEVCAIHGLARETVAKAFRQLRQKGIVTAIHGKGFFVASTETATQNRVFVMLDTFSAYKEVLFNAMKQAFGNNTILDVYFHHFNFEVFKNTIANQSGDYTAYIILPFQHQKIADAMRSIPQEKLLMLDIRPKQFLANYNGIYQDFASDVYEILTNIKEMILRYRMFHLIFRNTVTVPPKELEEGFLKFCKNERIECDVEYEPVRTPVKNGHAYLIIDDEDLVTLVESAAEQGMHLGKDIGIISYNDTSLKKVVARGISVISTDFQLMGEGIVSMIKNNDRRAIRNPTRFINRHSF